VIETQRCRSCGDFYRIEDEEITIETDDGWVIDICRQCHTDFNIAERELYEAWQTANEELCEEER